MSPKIAFQIFKLIELKRRCKVLRFGGLIYHLLSVDSTREGVRKRFALPKSTSNTAPKILSAPNGYGVMINGQR
eukprot:scaffold11434_cov115-Skeletonema_marinoi.AAC.4